MKGPVPKALFFNVPAHGHVNPSLPLVAELTRRGHDITYFTTEAYRGRVEAAGATVQIYAGVEDDYFDRRGLDGSVPQRAAQALLTTTEALLPRLLERIRQLKPDYILYDCMCPWGYFAGQITGLPTVSSASLMPLATRILLDWQNFRLLLPVIAKGFRAGNAAVSLSRALGRQYGVKPLEMLNVMNAPGDIVISYSSAEFIPFAGSLPQNIRMVGWTLVENSAGEPFVRDSQRPLVYVSLGTVANENAAFFDMSIRAFTGAPYDVLVSTGGRFAPEQFGAVPDNITVARWAPQSQVLRQAALFVTHGGLNSVHDGLYCGLPLLVVPQQTEQTFTGKRVVELGAGLMLKKDELSAGTLRRSADRLLSDPGYRSRAARVGETLRTAGGVARAADEIEVLLERGIRALRTWKPNPGQQEG